jgi:hypothetical protein
VALIWDLTCPPYRIFLNKKLSNNDVRARIGAVACASHARSSSRWKIFSSSCGMMLSQQSITVRGTLSCEPTSTRSSTLLYKFFLGAFAKLRKATINLVMPVRSPFCPTVRMSDRMEQLSSHWTDFHKIWY